MPNYVFFGDETGLLASNGDVKIIGDLQKKKHENHAGASRNSISMYRTGSAAGSTGPTVFLPPGERRQHGFTDKFLVEGGAKPGSTIVMTPSGYMTTEAWRAAAPSVCKGLRAMPVVAGTPDWYAKLAMVAIHFC